MPIPQITTPPIAHRPLSESDSIHLDSKPELRQPHVAVSHRPEFLPSRSCKQENDGELFLLFNMQNCRSYLIKGSKYLMRKFLFIFQRLDEMRGALKTYSSADPTKIPTFFPPEDDPDQARGSHLGIAIISMLFGLIHCLGWSLIFPSDAERLIWRVSAVIISALPVLIIFSYSILLFLRFLYKNFFRKFHDNIGTLRPNFMGFFVNWVGIPIHRFRMAIWWIFVILIPIYLFARMVLLVEAFLSLRSLPSGAYSVVNWAEYLPHI